MRRRSAVRQNLRRFAPPRRLVAVLRAAGIRGWRRGQRLPLPRWNEEGRVQNADDGGRWAESGGPEGLTTEDAECTEFGRRAAGFLLCALGELCGSNSASVVWPQPSAHGAPGLPVPAGAAGGVRRRLLLARVSCPLHAAEGAPGVLGREDRCEPGARPADRPGVARGGLAGAARVGACAGDAAARADAGAAAAGGGVGLWPPSPRSSHCALRYAAGGGCRRPLIAGGYSEGRIDALTRIATGRGGRSADERSRWLSGCAAQLRRGRLQRSRLQGYQCSPCGRTSSSGRSRDRRPETGDRIAARESSATFRLS